MGNGETTKRQKRSVIKYNDLDLSGGHVQGSATSKKYMWMRFGHWNHILGTILVYNLHLQMLIIQLHCTMQMKIKRTIKILFTMGRFRSHSKHPVAGEIFRWWLIFLKHVLGVNQKTRIYVYIRYYGMWTARQTDFTSTCAMDSNFIDSSRSSRQAVRPHWVQTKVAVFGKCPHGNLHRYMEQVQSL